MNTLAAMRTFVAIVDAGSLTAAASHLDRSQPAVVRTLAALEKHLGARLLNRTTRRMSLTPEGADYLERCRQILSDVEDAEAVISRQDAEPHGHVRITAPQQFGSLHVTPVMARILEAHPRLTTELLLFDRNVNLVEEGVDLAIRIGPLPDSGLVAMPIGALRRVVCASPALLDTVRTPTHPSDLESLPCLRLQLTRSGTWRFVEDARPLTVRVSGPLACNQISAAVKACEAGVGFGQFLSYQVQDALRTGRLVRVLVDFEQGGIPVHVVHAGGRYIAARVQMVARTLQARLRERVFRNDR